MELRDKLPDEHKELVIQHGSLLRCVEKAACHGIGETFNIVTNLLLKKREHVMSMAYSSVLLSTKTDIIFSPVSSCKLLPPDEVKLATSQFQQQTETSALVAVAAASKASTSKTVFKSTDFGRFYSSPLQDSRSRGAGKSSKKFFLRSREWFAKRDHFFKGKGQGKKSQSSASSSQ